MKTNMLLITLAVAILTSCTQKNDEYVDLRTGEKVQLVKDSSTGYMVNRETRKAVYLYVDPSSSDTFYGRTGAKANGNVRMLAKNSYLYQGDEEYIYEDGEYKPKPTGDGSLKMQDGDLKVKVQSDGDIKIKEGDYKKKIETNGDVKIKDGDTKVKIKDGKTKVKHD